MESLNDNKKFDFVIEIGVENIREEKKYCLIIIYVCSFFCAKTLHFKID
jgi:hypothetical protein